MKVYTAIAGNYDLLKEQPDSIRLQGMEFHAFMDRPQVSRTWNIQAVVNQFDSPRLNAKYHKVLPHLSFPDSEITLWIDGSIEIRANTSILNLAHSFLGDADIAVFRHPHRYCIYQEAIHCIHHRRDDREIIRKQVFRYTQEGYPANNGLAECTILLRRDTEQVREFNKLWWSEIQQGSVRDQISFPYVVWKTGIKVNYLPGVIADRKLFVCRQHLQARRRMRRTKRQA